MVICELCGNSFDYKGLWAHKRKKHACISQSQLTNLYKKLKQLTDIPIQAMNDQDQTKVDVLITNIQKTVDFENDDIDTIHSFGKENFSIVTNHFEEIEKANKESFAKFIELVYCNSDLEENRTIRVTSTQGIYCKIYKNTKWHLATFDKVMIKLAIRFVHYMKSSQNEKFRDYLSFIQTMITKKEQNDVKKFKKYTKNVILPIFYNISKNEL